LLGVLNEKSKRGATIFELLLEAQCGNVRASLKRKKISVAESIVYQSIVVATQCASWICGQLLRLRYSVRIRSTKSARYVLRVLID
jgi:hypothetical protein